MNSTYYVIAFLVVVVVGLLILRKKMNVNKEDFTKLKNKISKKRLTEEEKEFEKNGVLIPCDKRDFENFESFKESVKDNPKTMERLDRIDSDFEKLEYSAPVEKK